MIFTGWYKMQCVIGKPEMTIADLKQYLHEKNGARMPIECSTLVCGQATTFASLTMP